MHTPQPCSRREHWHPPNDILQLLAEYIQNQYTNPTDIYSPNCWQNISNKNIYNTGDQFAAKGPNLLGPIMPGPNLPGSNLPGPNLLPRGPICQTMANWAPKSAGPNLPPNRRGAQFSKNHLIYHQVAWSQKLFCLLSDNLLVKSLHKWGPSPVCLHNDQVSFTAIEGVDSRAVQKILDLLW